MDALIGLGVAMVSMPVAVVLTILLVPFWSWIESVSGIESLGHSGPSEWCYLIIYLLVVIICGWLWSLLKTK